MEAPEEGCNLQPVSPQSRGILTAVLLDSWLILEEICGAEDLLECSLCKQGFHQLYASAIVAKGTLTAAMLLLEGAQKRGGAGVMLPEELQRLVALCVDLTHMALSTTQQGILYRGGSQTAAEQQQDEPGAHRADMQANRMDAQGS